MLEPIACPNPAARAVAQAAPVRFPPARFAFKDESPIRDRDCAPRSGAGERMRKERAR